MEGSSFNTPKFETDLTNFDPSNLIKIMPEEMKEREHYSVSVKDSRMEEQTDTAIKRALILAQLLDGAVVRSATLPGSIEARS